MLKQSTYARHLHVLGLALPFALITACGGGAGDLAPASTAAAAPAPVATARVLPPAVTSPPTRLLAVSTSSLTATSTPAPAAVTAPMVFRADYEDGTVSSGYPTTGSNRMEVPGIEPGLATAPDAAYVVAGGAHNTAFAVANKVVLDDPAYVGGGFPRSEFGLGRIAGASYIDGDHGTYAFSMLLKDLVPSVKGTRSAPSEDVVWQFKHHGGGHDIHLALQGTQLILGWGGNVFKQVVIADVTPYVNQWMDFRFDILWKSDKTGYFIFDMKLPGEPAFGHIVAMNGLQTYVTASPDGTPWTGTGSVQYGVYRNGANFAAGDTKTLIVYHDEVTATNFGADGGSQLLANTNFESTATWSSTGGVVCDTGCSGESAISGSGFAWFDGYGSVHTDTLSQSVTIPAGKTTGTLSFKLHIDTAETTTTKANDKLTVQVGSTTVATFSNLNKYTSYAVRSYNVPVTAGSNVTVSFTGAEDSALQTSFVLDDVTFTAR
jgi:hypothetical protein